MTGSDEELPFPRLIRSRMEEKGLGLRELCREVGVDPSFFSKVLAGKRNPPAEEEVLERIAGVLDLEPGLVVVSAGRIPRRWSRIWREPGLYERVREFLTGSSHVKKPERPSREADDGAPRANSWSRRPRAEYVRQDLDEELL